MLRRCQKVQKKKKKEEEEKMGAKQARKNCQDGAGIRSARLIS